MKVMFDGVLPEHCYDCPIQDCEDGHCKIDGRTSYDRPFWCPLSEAPQGAPDDSFIKLTRMDNEVLYIRKREIVGVTPGQQDHDPRSTSIWMAGSGDSYYYVREKLEDIMRLLGALERVTDVEEDEE